MRVIEGKKKTRCQVNHWLGRAAQCLHATMGALSLNVNVPHSLTFN